MIQALAIAALVALGASVALTGRSSDGEGFFPALIAFVLLAASLALPMIIGWFA